MDLPGGGITFERRNMSATEAKGTALITGIGAIYADRLGEPT
jgi:hypothetical protein